VGLTSPDVVVKRKVCIAGNWESDSGRPTMQLGERRTKNACRMLAEKAMVSSHLNDEERDGRITLSWM
jgi:hypothetical protein